jgi:uncharacterized protein YbcI
MPDQPQARPFPEEETAQTLREVSNEIVRLYKADFGRGPTKARTDWCGPDALITTVEDSFTPAERNLARMGEHQRLRDTRLYFQHATEPIFVRGVERMTGRTVRAFVSGSDTHVDLHTEAFYFYPVGQEGPSAAERTGRM